LAPAGHIPGALAAGVCVGVGVLGRHGAGRQKLPAGAAGQFLGVGDRC
jgi:hypothetical protein